MRRVGVIGTVGVVIVTLLMAMAGVASATWVQTQTPTISGERGSGFQGVSCGSPTMCVAVGSYLDSSGHSHILAESWNGSSWTVTPTSDPLYNTASGMNAVSCVSTTSCVAVGSYNDSGGNLIPDADVWNGSSWTLWGGTLPNGAVGGVFNSVHCRSSVSCYAVGTWTDASNVTHVLADHWNASGWGVQAISEPSGATESDLEGIGCPTQSLCVAVGQYRDASNNSLSLVESWNGSTWSVQSTPNPSGSTYNQLDGVSCSTATQCTAVGSGFAEAWNGSTWTLQTIAIPHPNTGIPVLLGVSCRSGICAAVGYYYVGGVQTLVDEIWDGQKWVLQSLSISNPNDSSSLSAVSCKGSNACMAAGSFHNSFYSQNHSLAESFSLVWQQQSFTSPGASIAGGVSDVSCATTKFCAAVGSFETSTDFETYVDTWDGLQWNVGTVPNPSTTNLSAVSCSGPKACTAVGNGGNAGTGYVTLAERWNGTTWTAQTTPNQSTTGQGTYFTGVSCPTGKFCAAVGAYRDASGNQFPFAATWNGTTWVATPAPNPSGYTISELNRVSCTSATACVAVGAQGPSNPTALAEVWNGTTWTIQDPTFGSGFTDSSFGGVSCQTATSCTAVGSVYSTAAKRTFAVAQTWNGTTWTDQGALVPSGSKYNYLNDVSCLGVDYCMAVGSTATSTSPDSTLTETWNGTKWTMEPAPNPGSPQHTVFSAVSCPSLLLCIGVGYYSQSNGNDTFLAEQYS